MELTPHDLVKLHLDDVISFTPQPDWVIRSLEKAPYAVVRRASFMKDLVPIGIRGEERHQRFAAFLPRDKIAGHVTPEQLAERKTWRSYPRTSSIAALDCLERVDAVFAQYKWAWGPTGSVGFELASGVPAAKQASDLDLVVRVPEVMGRSTAQAVYHELCTAASVRVDVQLDTPSGIVTLMEYARGSSPLLVRTENGPRLTEHPWLETS